MVCNWYLYHEQGIIEDNHGSLDLINPKSNNLDIGMKIKDDNFSISIKAPSNGTYTIRITDVYGTLLKEQVGDLVINRNALNINLRELQAGNYIYTVIVDGIQLTTGKFILEK